MFKKYEVIDKLDRICRLLDEPSRLFLDVMEARKLISESRHTLTADVINIDDKSISFLRRIYHRILELYRGCSADGLDALSVELKDIAEALNEEFNLDIPQKIGFYLTYSSNSSFHVSGCAEFLSVSTVQTWRNSDSEEYIDNKVYRLENASFSGVIEYMSEGEISIYFEKNEQKVSFKDMEVELVDGKKDIVFQLKNI